MIRTKQPQVLDALNRINAVVYMDTDNRREPNGVVVFDVLFKVLDVAYETITEMRPNGEVNEEGNPIMVSTEVTYAKPYFKLVHSREAKYKTTTFYSAIGSPNPSQYDALMISQIEYVNSRAWTGNELQQVYFWDLTSNDLEVVSESELATLLTPYEVTI